ncbi:hypothetical protein QJ857_gp0428 [Tupanvirus soda lake]|uniref:Uncharacterized protein n=2 Tax=Tupanvirus TaxID=2094720 RepID=A0A6N1NT57_9VIRU|nr:hypothetical protein QJ857_gp0428 [Tupanvirus soda lake]QKU35607.1 hypothetical protein [Tupanvirus soda lake]
MNKNENTNFNKYYKIVQNSSDLSQYESSHGSLEDAIHKLYNVVVYTKNIDKNIICYSYDIPISTFKVFYNEGLVLYNEENTIKISSLFPEFAASDIALGKIFKKESKSYSPPDLFSNLLTKLNGTTDNSNIMPMNNFPTSFGCTPIQNNQNTVSRTVPTTKTSIILPKQRHSAYHNKAKIAEKAAKNINNNIKKNKKNKFDEEFEAKKERERNQRISQNKTNEKLRIFESDKNSYVKMKKDLENGTLKMDEMHPCFVIKHDIFKVLEARNAINFESNDNIKNEYEIFSDLYDSFVDEEENKEDTSLNVYIPHNYHYMSAEKKEEHAQKYKMTRKQFEEKYVYGMIDDDVIEKHIKNGGEPIRATKINDSDKEKVIEDDIQIKKPCNDNDKNNDKNIESSSDDSDNSDNDSDSDIDFDTDSESEKSKPKIDQRFLELTREYNKKN